MKILVITTSFPTSADGREAAGSFVLDFVQTLADKGEEVAVVAPYCGELPVSQLGDINYFWFKVPTLPLSLLSPGNPSDWLSLITTIRAGERATESAAEAFRPDAVFALWALPSGHWARKIKKRHNVPYSIWALGSDIWSLGRIPILRNYLKKILRQAKHRFADGYQLSNDVKRISGEGCEFLPSTRQLPACGLVQEDRTPPYRLSFLGRWHPNKGIDLLLTAIEMLTEADWGKIESIHIAGGGPLEVVVGNKVRKLQEIGRPVRISGYMDKREAAGLLIWSDYVMVPSRIESIPVIFSDAMQAMRPVIVMPVGDLPMLLNKFNCGVLVGEISAVSMVQSIRIALEIQPSAFNGGLESARQEFFLPSIVAEFVQRISNPR